MSIDLKNIPINPGCYIYKNKHNEIIYIGKAKSLKKRVKSYFNKNITNKKTLQLVKEIETVEFFITDNEVEALILENNLIKKHKPIYNINLKDSKRYAYIIITEEKFPRILVLREKSLSVKKYGPFVSAEQRDSIIKILRSTFKIRTCNKLPKKVCLRYHINLCNAPCINNISEEDYLDNIRKAEMFLSGKTKTLIKKLSEEMTEYSKRLFFEKAKIVRDELISLNKLSDKQNVELAKNHDQDIINYIINDDMVYLIVFNVNKGMLTTKNEFSFNYNHKFLEEFITQYYSNNKIPKEIILPYNLKDESIKDYLTNLRDKRVIITIPKIGDKLALLKLVKKNIELSFLNENNMIKDLAKELRLNNHPRIIESFDISHISGTNIVAGMVQFVNAKPSKSGYRRFKLKTVLSNDDFASIKEVVKRRYKRLKEENKSMPDLILIDGGKGQLSSAIESLKELELKIPIISIAKKEEEIFFPGSKFPLKLDKNSKALKLVQQIRDETHRFAIKYHRELRSKNMKLS